MLTRSLQGCSVNQIPFPNLLIKLCLVLSVNVAGTKASPATRTQAGDSPVTTENDSAVYRQDTLTAPHLTHLEAKLVQIRMTRQ